MLLPTRRWALATGLLLLSLPSRAEDEPRKIGLKAGAEAVAAEIEVLVTDAKGHPVLDLSKDDFRLVVDGRPMPIDWVEAPPRVERMDREAAAPTPALPDSAAAPRRPPHSTVIVVDEWHLDFASRLDGLTALAAAIRSLPEDEEVAFYSFGHGVRRVVPFTRDHAAVLAALWKMGRTIPIQGLGGARQLLRSLTWILHTLANRPEPKTVLMLAGSLSEPVSDAEKAATIVGRLPAELQDAQGEFASDTGRRGTSFAAGLHPFSARAADEAMLAQATVVALDPTGIRADEISADSRQPSTSRVNAWAYRTDALAVVAERTGGSRLGFTNDSARALARETALLSQRYRIGFTPRDRVGDARRDVLVEVVRKGLRVRAPAGQRTRTPDAAGIAQFASLLLAAEKPSADFELEIQPRPVSSVRGKLTALRYELVLPMGELLFQEEGGRFLADVEFVFAAIDTKGRTSPLDKRSVKLRLPEGDEGAKDGLYHYPVNLLFPKKGPVRLVFGVRDRTTGRLGVASVDLKL